MTNLDSILKGRDITLSTKVRLVKAMVFPVVMYGCESWTVKKAECGRIDAFELWCWRRLLRVLWTTRRSNQSILKEISPGCSLEGMMLKLKLQYLATSCKELNHWKRLWCWEGLGAGGEGDDRGWDGWMASPTRWTWVWVDSGSWWWTGRPGVLRFMESQRVGMTEQLSWTEPHLLVAPVKESICNVREPGLIPRSGWPSREGNGNPLQYSGLENSMDRGAWWATVHRVSKSFKWLSRGLFSIASDSLQHWLSYSSVQLLSHVRFLVTPWTAACHASLFITNSWSLLKLMSIEMVMPFNHFILCRHLL